MKKTFIAAIEMFSSPDVIESYETKELDFSNWNSYITWQ